MRLKFWKYHGAGNDFILLKEDFRDKLGTEMIKQLCDRHLGIGADGLIMAQPTEQDLIFMWYYNSDGKQASLCGNGGRCLAAFSHAQSWCREEGKLLAGDGVHAFKILSACNDVPMVALHMGSFGLPKVMDNAYFIDTGSPHHVTYVTDLYDMDIRKQGAGIRYSQAYEPVGANVDFVEPKGDSLHVRTYERGVEDETLACGTGVTAVALVDAFLNNSLGELEKKLVMPGGELRVRFRFDGKVFQDVWLIGPAVEVFQGEINIPL